MTGSYTGWLFKQAKGRVIWSSKSNAEIVLVGSIEMLFFGGLAFVSLFTFFNNYTTFFLPAIAVSLIGFWFGYQHILHGLREAQAAPLL